MIIKKLFRYFGFPIFALLILIPDPVLKADDDLFIFGSMQAIFLQEMRSWSYEKKISDTEIEKLSRSDHRASFAIQQLDVFINKHFSDNFSFFVDLEFKLNYNSDNDWGSFNLQEAWLSYEPSEKFNLKTGLLFPKFNNLNEIKNRLALFPTILRPVVYEQLLREVMIHEDVVPERAYLQASGFLPLSRDYRFEYAAYVGNSESSYISTNEMVEGGYDYLSGMDLKGINFKLLGARLGVRDADESFKFGVSVTYDHDNRNEKAIDVFQREIPTLGDVPRYRLGSDLSFNFGEDDQFEFTGELIKVFYDKYYYNSHMYSMGDTYFLLMLLYNLNINNKNNIYFYSSYEKRISDIFVYKDDNLSFGAGVKLNESITAKLQVISHIQDAQRPLEEVKINGLSGVNHEIFFITAGIGVLF